MKEFFLPDLESILGKDIGSLDLSSDTKLALTDTGINVISILASQTPSDLLLIQGLDRERLVEIKACLTRYLRRNGLLPSYIDQLNLFRGGELPKYGGFTLPQVFEMRVCEAAKQLTLTMKEWNEVTSEAKLLPKSRLAYLEHLEAVAESSPRLANNFEGLGTRSRNALQRAGYSNLDSVSGAKLVEILVLRNLGRESFFELLEYLKETSAQPSGTTPEAPRTNRVKQAETLSTHFLFREVSPRLREEFLARRLHPNIPYLNLTLEEWLESDPSQLGASEIISFATLIQKRLKFSTIDEELQEMLKVLMPRQIEILNARLGTNSDTLAEIGNKLNLTRERVRQLERRGKQLITGWLRRTAPWRLKTALLIAEDIGSNLSVKEWWQTLHESGLITSTSGRVKVSTTLELPVVELMMVSLRANETSEDPYHAYSIPGYLRDVWEHPGFKADEIEAAQSLTKEELRNVRRQVRNAGAASVILIARQLGKPVDTIKKALHLLGYVDLNEEWVTHSTTMPNESYQYSAFRINVKKMLAICGPLSLEDLRQGLQQHTSRFGIDVPPSRVLLQLIRRESFAVDMSNQVEPPVSVKIKPSLSEQVTLNCIKTLGPVVTYNELSEAFRKSGLSQPALAVTLAHSVLFRRVDSGLYGLYGATINQEDVNDALERQPPIEKFSKLSFDPDGKVIYEVSVGAYGNGGSLASGQAKRLSGEWESEVCGQVVGRVKVGDSFISGLGKTFRRLGVRVGDRIALTFDTRSRHLEVRKLRGANEEG